MPHSFVEKRNGEEFPRYSRFLLWLSFAATVAILAKILKYSGYGIDFTDESYYLVLIADPFQYDWSVSQFGFIYHPLYLALDGNIASIRRANVGITFLLSWILVDRYLKFILPDDSIHALKRIIMAAGFALASLAIFRSWLLTPSYNSLAIQSLFISSIGLLLADKFPTGKSISGWALIGIGGWLAFMAKPSTAMALAIGDLGAFSFHETKNVISGEGGALLVNSAPLTLRAEIIREKGTDRSRFFRGEIDKYTWQEAGSSFLPGELVAAFLWAQLEAAETITQTRLDCWDRYHSILEPLETRGSLRRPIVPVECRHNAHMYYVLLPPEIDRQTVLSKLRQEDVHAVFHYVPLHSSPGGRRYGRTHGSMELTDRQSRRLLRLPMWIGLTETQQNRVVDALTRAIS